MLASAGAEATIRSMLRPALALLALLAAPALGQDPPRFRWQAGDVLVAIEQDLVRETDERLGFAITTSHTVERRYTVLAVAADGSAEVLVEITAGPQELHEYIVRRKDDREAYRQKGFEPQATVSRRLLRATFPPGRFRCEPARDEPVVFYLQEIAAVPGHLLALPADGAVQWTVAQELTRLHLRADLARDQERVHGAVRLTAVDPRVENGAPVRFPAGTVEWTLQDGLPHRWRFELPYTRFPIQRPNRRVITGELVRSTPLDDRSLARLQADWQAQAAVHDAFHHGRFADAITAANGFLAARPGSLLAPQVQAELAAFRAQVPRFGQELPELPAGECFGGVAPTLAALRGKVVVLDFWAVWCVPCVHGMAHLIQLQRAHPEELQVLGLTRLDPRQTLAQVQEFHERGYAAAHEGATIPYPLLVLGSDVMHEACAVQAIPKLVVLDRAGRVWWEQTGAGDQARLDRILATLRGDGR